MSMGVLVRTEEASTIIDSRAETKAMRRERQNSALRANSRVARSILLVCPTRI